VRIRQRYKLKSTDVRGRLNHEPQRFISELKARHEFGWSSGGWRCFVKAAGLPLFALPGGALAVERRGLDRRNRKACGGDTSAFERMEHFTEEIVMVTVVPTVPPTAELFTKAQLAARHPHLLSANRLVWALRRRTINGLSGAVFDSPCGELSFMSPPFLPGSSDLRAVRSHAQCGEDGMRDCSDPD